MQIDKSKKFSQFFEPSKVGREIDFLVLHHIEADCADHAIEQLCQHQVSSHFLIDEDGKIFELVAENDIAFHAGVSFWKGCDSLNKRSLGIEFANKDPFKKGFAKEQMQSGVILSKYLTAKYNIKQPNIVSHSDIAYDRKTKLLNRKQDPSHLFDWSFFAQNGISIFPKIEHEDVDEELFKLGDNNSEISTIKKNLHKFGYYVNNFNDDFDLEMQALTIVFNRRFCGEENKDVWSLKSQKFLDNIIS